MDGNEIIEKVSIFEKAILERTAEVNVMMVDQNNQRKHKYKGLMLKTNLDDIESVITDSISYIKKELSNRTLDKYDLEISIDNSTQVVNKSEVINGPELLKELDVYYNDSNTINQNTNLSKIKFMVIQIFAKDKSIYLFKKYVQPTAAYKTTQKYVLNGGILKPFTKNIITISYLVDAFLLDENYFVFNRNRFNSIFSYKDFFKRILQENCEMIENSGLMIETHQFISDCETDGRYLPRLTKIILANGFEEVSKKKKGIKKIVEDYNLSLELSESGEIIYKNKEDIPEILDLLLSHYVRDSLTSNKMIAKAIEKYQIGTKRRNH